MNRKAAVALLILFLVAIMASAQATSKAVYYTPKGGKYHLQTCRTLKKSKVVLETTLEDAKKMGLQACQVCHPGE